MKKPGSASDPLWYKDAILYELHVRAFSDSDNDGIGDFRGLTQRLDYLQDLGVTCLWLLPFFPSPLRDDGYDIADYLNVHPDYGTLEDFLAFLERAHERGLQVMIELVINHTSDRHAWFQRARLAPPGSVERDYYVWSDTDQQYADARIIFTDTEKSNWTWDPVAQAYYWHRFFSHQPDLNFDNPAVVEEVLAVMRYWPRRISGRATSGRTSATGTNATWPSTFRSCRGSSWASASRTACPSRRSWRRRRRFPSPASGDCSCATTTN
jgi:maltose alpha-D-glucosyltransferase/alpha-amylase